MSFTELQLSAPLLRAVAQLGHQTPTPIQKEAIPAALAGRDLLASAQTGTGKTGAFLLPALQRLAAGRGRGPKGAPRLLVLAPTRELAQQVFAAARDYGRHLRLHGTVIYGGAAYGPQFRDLGRPIDLVVGTPGRIIDHLDRGSLDLSRLEILVLDEADRMLDMGFKPAVERIGAAAAKERQTMLFTATLDRQMATLAGRLLNAPVRIDIAGDQPTLEKITQKMHVADDLEHKKRLLFHLAGDASLTQAIVFSATKRNADRLARELCRQGHAAAALHGDMSQAARNRTVRQLRQGRLRLLVATDVAARGIDVPAISHVINFDLPQVAEDYIHRIGRTGRAGAAGTAVSLVANGPDTKNLQGIERLLGQRLDATVIPGLEPRFPLRRGAAGRQDRSRHQYNRRPARRFAGAKPLTKRPARRLTKEQANRP